MSIFNRIFYLYAADNPSKGNVYAAVCQELQAKIARYLPDQNAPNWPNGHCNGPDFQAMYVEWRAKTADPSQLLHVQLQLIVADTPWEVDVRVASKAQDRMIVTEAWHLRVYQHQIPYSEMSTLLDFLSTYECKNEDGYWVGKFYAVSPERVAPFVAFLHSPERRLPVLLTSPGHDHALNEIHRQLPGKVRGLAHVIRLRNETAVTYLRQLLPNHSCYNGAIRLYWPGFQPDDPSGKHPYKLPAEQVEMIDEWFDRLAQDSPRLFGRNPDVSDLERQRETQYHQAESDFQKKRREAVRQRIEAEKNAEEYIQLYESLEREQHDLQAQVADLEVEVTNLRDENRQLRWRLNTVWQQPQLTEHIVPEGTRLWLSAVARAKYLSLAAGETRYWERNILPKLLEAQSRNHQSERVKTKGGPPCFVYPRTGSADGRRVIYYCQDENVYVCEIFTGGEHNTSYAALRNQGVDRASYGDFQAWDFADRVLREDSVIYDADEAWG
jgi:hypothetical protein